MPFWNTFQVLIIFSQNTLFSFYIINVAPNPVQAEKSCPLWLLLIGAWCLDEILSWQNTFKSSKKKLYFNNKDKIVLHRMSEFTFEFEWAAVLQVLLEQKPTLIPSRASKNSTFCISWGWWNFVTVYRCLFLCSSQALSCFITTLPYYSWELWALSSPPRKKWTCCSLRDVRMKP